MEAIGYGGIGLSKTATRTYAPAPGVDTEFDDQDARVWEALQAAGNPEGITREVARETLARRMVEFGGKTYQAADLFSPDDEDEPTELRVLAELAIPKKATEPYWYEKPEDARLIDWYIMARRDLGTDFHGALIITGPAGCLAGDTVININRAGKGHKRTIKHITEQVVGGRKVTYTVNATGKVVTQKSRTWDPEIETKVARADGDVVKLGTLANAWYSGDKQTYTLTTSTGRSIRATATHPFLTSEGWKTLSELSPGIDDVMVNTGRSTRGQTKAKPQYRYLYTRFHPYQVASNGSHTEFKVPAHRLAMEADTNGLSLDEYVAVLRADPVRSASFTFIKPDRQVHHKDGDPFNNVLDNLVELSKYEHHSLHAKNGHGDHVLWQVGAESIQSIEPFGIEPTYDILMADEPHNFLANGFVVHNSGKTMGVPQAVARLNARHHLSMRLLKMDCATITDPQKWLGRREIDETGSHYIESDFIRACREGDVVILLDEITRLHPTIGNMIHSLLDGSQALHLSELNMTVNVSPTTVFLATANIGAQSGGTHRMDWALRERFAYTIERDFPPRAEEMRILTTHTNVDPDAAETLVDVAIKTRQMYATGDLRSPVSTRTLKNAAILVASGATEREALSATALPTFDGDANGSLGEKSERAQVMAAIDLRTR